MGVLTVLQVQIELFDKFIVCVFFFDRLRYFVPYFYNFIERFQLLIRKKEKTHTTIVTTRTIG